MTNFHQPVLLNEVIDSFKPFVNGGVYLDATFGRGGHSLEILKQLSPNSFLIGLDVDVDAEKYAQLNFKDFPNFKFVNASYAKASEVVQQLEFKKIDGALFDLGVSSPQLDEVNRGFSYKDSAPLDMRMDQTQELTAAIFLNNAELNEIIHLFNKYANRKFAFQVAKSIYRNRPLETTDQLVSAIKNALPQKELKKSGHPAKIYFQAIRMHINNEEQNILSGLEKTVEILNLGGKISVISFHSYEDKLVKTFFKKYVQAKDFKDIPINTTDLQNYKLSKKVLPSVEELETNRRSRSAILRTLEKVREAKYV
jgi:16S rRNA (cytosine1402-N4)-methyltransferase